MKSKTISLQTFNACPPIFCRIVARKNRGRAMLTRQEIARAGGLSLRQVDYLSDRIKWDGTKLETMLAFALGCRVNFGSYQRHVDWFRRRQKSAWRKCDLSRLKRLTQALSQKPLGQT